jgi:enediyne biosynthesis protein E4
MSNQVVPRRVLVALVLAALVALPAGQALQFDNAASQAKVVFQHSGPEWRIDPYPEVTGSGACWADVDQDGWDDLFLVNTRYWKKARDDAFKPRSQLFINGGDGTFRDVTDATGLGYRGAGQGCAFGDYDGDGFPDLYLSSYDQDVLYHNNGDGTFTNVTLAAGVDDTGLCGDFPCWGTGVAWLDFDRDGDLDIFVGNYVEWDGVGIASPNIYPGQRAFLWRNNGNGTFEEWSDEAGTRGVNDLEHSKAFAVVVNDYDQDGWPDVFVACDETVDYLYRNKGDGTFEEVAHQAGVADVRAGMGAEFEDITGDGWPDLYMTHYVDELSGFYTNNRDGTFTEHSGEYGLDIDLPYVKWGTGFHDFDNDGDNDLYFVNGHTYSSAANYHQPHILLRNDGVGAALQFTNITAQGGNPFTNATVGRGTAVSDYDHDGDLDIAMNNNGNVSAKLAQASDVQGNWVKVQPRQPGSNLHAIGARVALTDDSGRVQVRMVRAGHSFLSQDSLLLHFGMGTASPVQAEVRWPDGSTQTFTGLPTNGIARLDRSSGQVVRDTLSPTTAHAVLGVPAQNGYWRSVERALLVAQDHAIGTPSGVQGIEVRDPLTGAWRSSSGNEPLPWGEGRHTLWVRARDHAGNVEALWGREVTVDTTPPTSTARIDGIGLGLGWYQPAAVVEVEAHDASSGVAEIWWRLDGGPYQRYEDHAAVWDDRTHVFEWYVVDRAGNVAAPKRILVSVDGERPQGAFHRPLVGFDVVLGTVDVEVKVIDLVSGPYKVAFYLDDEPTPRHVDRWAHDGFTWRDNLGTEPGLHRVSAVAYDRAGNEDRVMGPTLLVLPSPLKTVAGAEAPPWV